MSWAIQIAKWPLRAWDDFFFRKVDLSIFGPIRIAFATFLLINVLVWWPDLDRWFGENGVLSLADSKMVIDEDAITIFQWLPTTSGVLWGCYLLLIANIIGLMIGLFTRFQLVCIFVLLTSFLHRNNLIVDSEDTLFRLMTFYLVFSPAGRFRSVDNWLRAKRNRDTEAKEESRYAVWPLRLIQIQTSAVLLFSGLEKLQGNAWIDGTALYYVSRLDDLFYRFPVPDFIFESLLLISIMTWATLVVEISVPILVWFRWTRLPALAIAVVFHLTLEYMMNLNFFQWMMLLGWASFINPDDVAAIKRLIGIRIK